METNTNISLDRLRRIRWTRTAEARLSLQGKELTGILSEMSDRSRVLYSVCLIIWASLVDLEHPWKHPEELAEFLPNEETQHQAIVAIREILTEAGVLQEPKKKESSESASSSDGPKPLLSSAPHARDTGTSRRSNTRRSSGRTSKRSAG